MKSGLLRSMTSLLLLLAVLLLSSAACATVPEPLQGTWRVAGNEGGMSWYKEITIDESQYKMEGYPPIVAEAKIEKVEEKGERVWALHVVDYVFNTDPFDDEVWEAKLSEDGKTLELRGTEYSRVE